jgi:peptidoglycan L-alanyl-D-glutamate endopeptidase CwlK
MPPLAKDGAVFDLARFDPKNLLAGLSGIVQTKAVMHGRRCAMERGILIKITHGLRTAAEQDALYAQGRTAPGVIVTAARAGYSWHNFGRAYDIAQIGAVPYPEDDDFWQAVGRIGEECGLEWGGDWKHPDRPHLEDRGGLTLAAARVRYGMGDTLA